MHLKNLKEIQEALKMMRAIVDLMEITLMRKMIKANPKIPLNTKQVSLGITLGSQMLLRFQRKSNLTVFLPRSLKYQFKERLRFLSQGTSSSLLSSTSSTTQLIQCLMFMCGSTKKMPSIDQQSNTGKWIT